MNEKSQRDLFNYLQKNNVIKFVGVPDSTMKHFIDEGLKKNKILISTREEEAIGISAVTNCSNMPIRCDRLLTSSINQQQ